jgi:hypothetical protein
MFKGRKVTGIPKRQVAAPPPATHAFRGNAKPKGVDDVQVVVDSGILIAAAASQSVNGPKRFGDRYEGRATTTDVVREEIINRATSVDVNKSAARTAAKSANNYLLKSGRVPVHELNVFESAALLQRIHDQLVAVDEARALTNYNEPDAITKHAGEATLIVHALLQGVRTILTNDSGASLVASRQEPQIRSLHFGDVLRELVCASNGEVDADTAAKDFATACSISGINEDAKPSNPKGFFTCHRGASGSCTVCD